jgi:NADH dehydrogenase FAD-containing subunit
LKVHLIEGSESTLNNMSDLARKSSQKYLGKMGVRLKTGVFVNDYDGNVLKLSNGETIKSKSVIWAAGVTGNVINGLEKSVHLTNRYIVNRINEMKGYFAWFVWMFLHLMLILSVRNKLIIFINWLWNYLSKNSSLRLILKEIEDNNNSDN